MLVNNLLKKITKTETNLLKTRIKALAKGARQAKSFTTKQIFNIQAELTDIITESDIEAKDKAKFLKTIKNINTPEKLNKYLPTIEQRIENLGETSKSKIILKQLTKEINATVAKGKKPKGKYTADIQRVLDKIRPLVNLTQKKS